MDKKFCPDCNKELPFSEFAVKGKKRDGSLRYDKYCRYHRRERDRRRKSKKDLPQRDSIELQKKQTNESNASMSSEDVQLSDINVFNEYISILKEEYEKLKGCEIYVKS